MQEYDEVMAVPLEIKPFSKVLIRQGILMDKEATVKEVMRNKVEVEIESLGYKLVARLKKSNLIPVSG
jgi:transcription antitermination factor NusG